MGDKNQLFIFDIDSALDKLENEENENQQETFSRVNTQQKSNEITKQQSNQDYIKEENGNVSTPLNNTSLVNYEDSSVEIKGELFFSDIFSISKVPISSLSKHQERDQGLKSILQPCVLID